MEVVFWLCLCVLDPPALRTTSSYVNPASGNMTAALNVFKEMRKMECSPDIITFNTLVHGFSEIGDVAKAKAIIGGKMRDQLRDSAFDSDHDVPSQNESDMNVYLRTCGPTLPTS